MLFALTIHMLWSVVSMVSELDETDNQVQEALSAIKACVTAFETDVDEPFPTEIDRAYVHVFEKRFNEALGITFAYGEAGSFGSRSQDFRPVLACGVSSNMQVVLLVMPGSDPIREQRGDDQANPYEGQVAELLFEKGQDAFVFVAAQPLQASPLNELLDAEENVERPLN